MGAGLLAGTAARVSVMVANSLPDVDRTQWGGPWQGPAGQGWRLPRLDFSWMRATPDSAQAHAHGWLAAIAESVLTMGLIAAGVAVAVFAGGWAAARAGASPGGKPAGWFIERLIVAVIAAVLLSGLWAGVIWGAGAVSRPLVPY